MLYQLIHLWNSTRQDGEKSTQVDRRMAQVVQRYYAGIYFEDLNVIEKGPLCSIDIDGVLESKLLGFSSLSPESARSLRALNLHGYRVILATGRSLEELEERCATYKLCGGVAEYGAVLYDHSSGQVKVLLSDEELETLYKVRSKLSNKRGVFLDNDYRFSVRAYCLDGDGRRTRLDDESIEQVLLETATAVQVYAIQGVAQTDFMVKRIDKGVGLKEWLASFDHSINDIDGEIQTYHPIRFAVGDSATDLPMFQLAALSFAPANASPEVKQAKIVETTHSVQRGMEQAVTRLIGHKPGSCSICRLGELSAHTQFMQELLVTNENGRLGMLWELARLFVTNGGRLHVSP
jgi:hydroxymethylpyrimidine pyrophosphatase-like HAD family hydrolase